MKWFFSVVLLCVILSSNSTQVIAQEQGKYKVVDLGKSDFPLDKLAQILNQAQMVFTPCLNRDGSIVAWYTGRADKTEAFIHQLEQGKTSHFPSQGKNKAHVGKFTGKIVAGGLVGPPPRALYMELGGKETLLGDKPSQIHAVNKAGQMVGWEFVGSAETPHALIAAADGTKQLVAPYKGDGMSMMVDINDLGTAIGNSFGIDATSARGGESVHGFIVRPGAKPEWLDEKLSVSIARAISDKGTIAGAIREGAQTKACIWHVSVGGIKRAELLGGEQSNALCLSAAHAAGWLAKKAGDVPQAVIWNLANPEPKLVDELLHPDSKGWKIVAVTAIAENQTIAGIGISPNKEVHVFYANLQK